MKNNLISTAQTLYTDKNISDIQVEVKGKDLEQTRILTLKGTVATTEEKAEAEAIAQGIEGVYGIDNQLIVDSETPTIAESSTHTITHSEVAVNQDIKSVPKLLTPSPYEITVTKEKNGKITLEGYVNNSTEHQQLISNAEETFGATNVIDKLKESMGAPLAWQKSSMLGLKELHSLEYGHFNIKNQVFTFNGYVSNATQKVTLTEALKNKLDGSYQGLFQIDAPEAVMTEVITVESQTEQETNVEEKTTEAFSCQSEFKALMANHKIHFAYNKAVIKSDSYKLLQELIDIAKSCPNETIVIAGHTDSDGKESYNKALSEKRANAVKRYLVKKGISTSRLESIGYGENNPIADNATKQGKEKNRRIEFNLKGVE